MTLYEFNSLLLNKRSEYIWNNGTFIGTRSIDHFKINLYHTKEFFAEIWYDTIDNKIENIKSFTSKAALEPYLELIKIDIS